MLTRLSRFFFIVVAILSVCEAVPHPLDIIFTGPAPPPEEGPPLSASAVRDVSLLWREIVAIVSAYVGSVCILLGLLLTVGRRLRRQAQESNPTLEIEMFKPSRPPAIDTKAASAPKSCPTSPNKSPNKGKGRSFSKPWSSRSRGPSSPASHNGSVSTIDEGVVQADRQRAQEEMERLYAAVMEHDAQQSKVIYDANDNSQSPVVASQPRSPIDGFPEFQHLRNRQHPISPTSAKSPSSPLSPATIPEEDHYQQQPQSPQDDSSSVRSPRSPITDKLSRLSGLSFLSSKSRDGQQSPRKLSRQSVRRLPISPPIRSPNSPGASPYADNQPLSPRIYQPGPPPLNPVQKATSRLRPVSPSGSAHPVAPSPLSQYTAGTSTSSLPFRQAFSPPQSPSTKTTVVEWRQSLVRAGGPRTGVPRTPYSPYMPFTPLTPITPSRIVTKGDRKRRQKETGVRVQTIDDMVMSDEDMWGS